jgi:hypothetical protein
LAVRLESLNPSKMFPLRSEAGSKAPLYQVQGYLAHEKHPP